MQSFSIASWNVNSIIVRIDQVNSWLEQSQIDILALQETKTSDEKFPLDSFNKSHNIYFYGQKSYNGVAIISKNKLQSIMTNPLDIEDSQARVITAVNGDILIINVYVPNGSTPDSDKFQYKINWLDALIRFIKQQQNEFKKIIILGDFNIAPHDIDTHDPEKWQDTVLCNHQIRSKLGEILSLGFFDSYRMTNPDSVAYSWWDYRMASFRRNLGLRIDLILISEALKNDLTATSIDKTPRKNERPSDHTPVIAEFKL